MKFQITFRNYRLFCSLAKYIHVSGVNSKLANGRHFLMWDFDNLGEEIIRNELLRIQKKFHLSQIYLINTGLTGYYHAYCFLDFDWANTLYILASTQGIDKMYFTIGVARGYFTLRYTPKKSRDFKPAIILSSKVKETVNPYTLKSFIDYPTKRGA